MLNLFVCLVRYTKSLEEVSQKVEEHRAYLRKGYESGILLASGPKNPKDGGIIIGKFASKNEALKFAESDPYVRHDVAEYEILEFEPVLHSDILTNFLAKV